jgi:hypothetical protein
VSFTCDNTAGNYQNACQATINAINASSPTNTLVVASLTTTGGPQGYLVYITALPLGAAGNGIPTTTNGVGGSFWYPGGATFDGSNSTLTIEGVTFQAPFDTDADTTVNDLITLINASGPTVALVTPTLVNHQLLLTAVASGVGGNAITISSPQIYGSFISGPNLTGGADGLVGNVATIVICTVPPFGQAPGYTSGKNTQRTTLNTAIAAITGAGISIADADSTLRDSADHTLINPSYIAADDITVNDAGHAALYTLISALV